MEAIDVLARIDPIQDAPIVDLARERQLDQDAMDRRVGIQSVDRLEESRLRDVGREPVDRAVHAGGLAGVPLVANVDPAGGVVAHEDDREAGDSPGLAQQEGCLRGDFPPNLLGEGLSIEDTSGQWGAPSRSRARERLS